MFKYLLTKRGYHRHFFSTASNLSHTSQQTGAIGKAYLSIYFWPPHPENIGGILSNPLLTRLLKKSAGHIAIAANFSDNTADYFSIWPQTAPAESVLKQYYQPVHQSKNLATDIHIEEGREPLVKKIVINAEQERLLQNAFQKFAHELSMDHAKRIRWSLINNCATYAAQLLHDGGLLVIKPDLMMTPRKVFHLIDDLEQKIYLEDLKRPSL